METAKTFAVIIGLEEFGFGAPLDGPARDAWRLAAWLFNQGVPKERIILLLAPLEDNKAAMMEPEYYERIVGKDNVKPNTRAVDWPEPKQADYGSIEEALKKLRKTTGDLLVFFWTGHGAMHSEKGRIVLLPEASEEDLDYLSVEDIRAFLFSDSVQCLSRQCVVFDACSDYTSEIGVSSASRKKSVPNAVPYSALKLLEQRTYFAAYPGQEAMNNARKREGLFFGVLFRELEKGGLTWGAINDAWEPAQVAAEKWRVPQRPCYVSRWGEAGAWEDGVQGEKLASWRVPLNPLKMADLRDFATRCAFVQGAIAAGQAPFNDGAWLEKLVASPGGLERLAAAVVRQQGVDLDTRRLLKLLDDARRQIVSWEHVARCKALLPPKTPAPGKVELLRQLAGRPGQQYSDREETPSFISLLDEFALVDPDIKGGFPFVEYMILLELEGWVPEENVDAWQQLQQQIIGGHGISLHKLREVVEDKKQGRQDEQTRNYHLMVQISPRDGIHAEAQYAFRYWLIDDGGSVRDDDRKTACEGTLAQLGEFTLKYLDAKDALISELIGDDNELLIELLVPTELLDEDFESEIAKCRSFDISLTRTYPVLLRASSRISNSSHRVRKHWKQRWETVAKQAVVCADTGEHWPVNASLWICEVPCFGASCFDAIRDEAIGLATRLWMAGNPDSKIATQETLQSLVASGIPVVLWSSPAADNPQAHRDALKAYLQKHPLMTWPDMLYTWRYKKSGPYAVGGRATLIWDNPNLLPPAAGTTFTDLTP